MNKFVLITLFSLFLEAEEVETYCFRAPENVKNVSDRISFILTDRDKIQLNSESNCVDIYSSENRMKVIDKLIRKNFNPIDSVQPKDSGNLDQDHCRIELTETKKRNIDERTISAGEKNKVSDLNKFGTESNTTQLLLAYGRPGSIDIEGKSLNIVCVKNSSGNYHLNFYINSSGGNKISSDITVSPGQNVEVGSIVKDLDNKSKEFGISKIEFNKSEGKVEIRYTLKVI